MDTVLIVQNTNRLEKIDQVGCVDLYVTTISEKIKTPRPLILFLQVVNSNGNFFTLKDLDEMALGPNEVFELMDLCFRKFKKFCVLFLPNEDPEAIAFNTDRYEVDENGFIRVEFSIEY